MFSALLRVKLASLFKASFGGGSRKERGPVARLLMGLLFVYVFACFILMFGMFFSEMVEPFHSLGLDWFYFATAGVSSAALCFITTVFMAQNQLYKAKDNDLLFAMPIPAGYILLSRLAMLFIMNMIMEAIVMLPAAVVYGIKVGMGAAQILLLILGALLISMLMVAISSFFGYIFQLMSRFIKNRSLFTTLIYIAFLGAYFYFYSKINVYIQKLVANGESIAAAVKKALPMFFSFGKMIAEVNLGQLLVLALWCALPALLAYFLLSRSFIKISTSKAAVNHVEYRAGELKVSGAMKALCIKEIRHFFSNPMYVMNAGLGIIFTAAAGVFALIKRADIMLIFEEVPELGAFSGFLGIMGMCLLSSMIIISAPSVSLEAKNLWLLKSLPISAGQALLAKAYAHFALCLPASLFTSLALSIVLKPSAVMCVMMFVVPISMNAFCALLGVALNLHFPKLDWLNETVAIKQGASPLLSMLITAALVISVGLLYMLLLAYTLSPELYCALFALALAAMCALLYCYLKNKCEARFMGLNED